MGINHQYYYYDYDDDDDYYYYYYQLVSQLVSYYCENLPCFNMLGLLTSYIAFLLFAGCMS